VVLAFTQTKIKVWKKWNTAVSMCTVPNGDRKIKPPRWAHLVKISATREKNAHGSFFNFTLSPANGSIKDSLLQKTDEKFQGAKAVAEMVKSGLARAAEEPAQEEEDSDAF
jgi:hypothetical protein